MGIKDSIIKGLGASTEENKIMNALRRCFYAEHKPDEEARMVKLIQLKNGESRERYGLHASTIIKDNICMRCQVLSLFYRQGQGADLPLKTLAIFEEGNAIHEKWQRLFIRGELGEISDMDTTRFAHGYELLYTPDAIIKIDGIEYIVEIKSMNTFVYQKFNDHSTGGLQCLLYMYLANIHNGFVLMEDKNTQDFKIQIVEYDEEKLQPIINNLKEIQKLKAEFIKNKKPPKRVCESSDSVQAVECIMRDCCFNIGMGRQLLYDKDFLIHKEINSILYKKSLISSEAANPVINYYNEIYSENKDKRAFADYLKKHYGTGGYTGTGIIDMIDYNSGGFTIYCKRMNGDECESIKHHYSWLEVVNVIIAEIQGQNIQNNEE